VGQLRVHGAFQQLALLTGAFKLAVEIGLRSDPARRFHFPPGGPKAGIGIGADRGADLDRHLLDFAPSKAELVPLDGELALEHDHPLAVTHGEPPCDSDRLRVGHRRGQSPAPLRVVELLPLGRKLAFGRAERVAHAVEPERRFRERIAQGRGPGAGIGYRLREQPVEPGPQRFESAQREDSWERTVENDQSYGTARTGARSRKPAARSRVPQGRYL